MTLKKKLHILGIRGIPAHHGGFESFAENLSLHLVKNGWDVTVYCQEDAQEFENITRDEWQGVKRVRIPVRNRGNLTSMIFDWQAIKQAVQGEGPCLVLGYNTAIFSLWLRLKGRKVIFNMDGLEWKRSVWPLHGKVWFFFNEWLGAWIGNHLIADNPEIKRHLQSRVFGRNKITTIAYGAREIKVSNTQVLDDKGIGKRPYALVVARPVQENHIFEIVKAWSSEERGCLLVVLGELNPETPYHQAIMQATGAEVLLLGGVYDKGEIDALRFSARFYIHGHSVGGTNPSLVESLGAGNAVLAHDNRFNRWVLGDAGLYFKDEADLQERIAELLKHDDQISLLQARARKRYAQAFQWKPILESYEKLLSRFI